MLRKNTAGQHLHITGVHITTGAIVSAATWTQRRCLDGTFAAGAATITEDGVTGFYKVALAQADTNANNIGFLFTATNCVPVTLNALTTAADPSDAVRFGLTGLANATAGGAGGLPIVGTGANNFKSDASANVTFANTLIATVTTLTNLPAITANWLTAAGIAATALNGKGDWNIGKTGYALTLADWNVGKTGYSLTATTGLGAQTANITGNLSGSVGSVTGAVGSVTGAVGSVAAGGINRAAFAADTGLVTIRSNTAQAGAATTITLDASASAVTDFYKNALISLTGGTGVGQGRFITAYNGTTKVATVAAWATNPDVTSTFAITAFDSVPGATAPTAAANATAVWEELTSTARTAGSYGQLHKDNVNATISSRSTYAGGDTAGTTTLLARLPSAITLAAGAVTVGTNNDKTGYGLSAAAVQAVWDAATTALTTVGSIGKKFADWVVGTIDTYTGNTKQTGDSFPRLGAPAGASVSADVAAIQAKTVNLPAAFPTNFAARVISAGGTAAADVLAIAGDTDAVTRLERVLSGNVTGTVGAGSTTTSIVTSAMSPAANVTDGFKGRIVTFDAATTTAALRGQSTDITASTAAGVLTVTALTSAPVSGDLFTMS